MESIGEKLRATREEKSLSVDQVARDTNIAKRYIVALEEEAFSEFPGEPYLVGFLRNYADYLGLDAEEIVGLYKNFKIQEQPVPMEELLEPKRSGRSAAIFIAIVAIVAIVVAAVIFLPPLFSKRAGGSAASTAARVASGTGTEYQLKDEIIERRFVAGDTVVVPVGDKTYKVKLSVAGRDLVLTDPNGSQTIKLGEEKSVDLNGDGTPDLKVFLRDIDTQDPAKGIIVRFDRFTQSPNATAAPQSAPATAQQAPAPAAPPAAAVVNPQPAAPATAAVQPAPQAAAPQPRAAPAAPAPTPPVPAQAAAVPQITPQSSPPATGPVVIANNATSDPFTVNVNFSGYCLFRYLIDGQSEDQRYFQKGETTRLEVKQDVEIWASNGGALSVNVAGNSVDLGNPGEVVARKIAWVKNPDSAGYLLEMTRLQ
ncbi:MAG TPA: helix-turn-helix domain-containing protein [Spirochaetia bacterium]|nr:helix-turn-helix domain-containing protein [Spirochaetia bacterium]